MDDREKSAKEYNPHQEMIQQQSWLIKQARAGSKEAFGELVRLHRAKAVRWAVSISRDQHLAEDIVQEALMRAFLKLGSLIDPERFVPWLQRIVRNEAYMKLRRGVPYARELPFSGGRQDDVAPAWKKQSATFNRRETATVLGDEPLEQMMKREKMELIQTLLRCLTLKERQIFQAFFFEEMTPVEIAELLSTSKSQIYTSLHRSKQKLYYEHLRRSIQAYLDERKENRCMGEKMLSFPQGYQQAATWTSMIKAMKGVLDVTELKRLTLAELMGYTSFAFRINIHPQDVDIAGPTAFIWGEVLPQALGSLGFASRYIGTDEYQFEKHTADRLREAIEAIQHSIDRGKPAIAWDLFVPEFGLIYGYDDEKQEFQAVDPQAKGSLPYHKLGQGQLKELAVLTVGEYNKKQPAQMLHDTLKMILAHAQGKERSLPGFVHGLTAYDTWIEAFRGGKVDPFGNAYNAAVVADARRFAAQFLLTLSGDCGMTFSAEERALAAKAAVHYVQVAESLTALSLMFPFPSGGDPNEAGSAKEAIGWLTTAKHAEEAGVGVLTQLSTKVSQRAC